MATAKAIPGKTLPNVELTLTGEEAVALRDVVYRIGGDPRTSRRRFFDSIGAALDSAEVQSSTREDIDPNFRAIYFK